MAKTVSQSLTFEQAQQKASALCSGSEYCISEIEEKIRKWGVQGGDAQKVVDYLVDEKYIDEARYAMAYTNDKLRFSHWGRVKIRSMLRMHKISDIDINRAFSFIDEVEYDDILRKVIESKQRTMREDIESYAARVKIIRFALQRGFEMDQITKFISEY